MRARGMGDGGAVSDTEGCERHPEVRVAAGQSCSRCERIEDLADVNGLGEPGPRFWAACLGTVVVAGLAVAREWSSADRAGPLSPETLAVAEGVLTTLILAWVLWPLARASKEAWAAARPTPFVPPLVGASILYLWSLGSLVFPDILPETARFADGSVPLLFAPTLAVAALLCGTVFWQRRGQDLAETHVQTLLEARPTVARLVAGGGEDGVAVRFVEPGDRVRVLRGERIPVDGVVLEGSSVVDESELNEQAGEVEKHPGDRVLAGTVNGRHALLVRAARAGADSTIVRLGRAAEETRQAPLLRPDWVPLLERHLATGMYSAAALSLLGLAVFASPPSLVRAVVAAVAVLVAVPTRLFTGGPRMAAAAAVSCGARRGVFLDGANALDRLGEVNTLVVERTGLLMRGSPQLTTFIALPPWEETELLRIAASLERDSDHPIAAAICAAAEASELELTEPRNVRGVPGKGIAGIVARHKVAIGGRALLEELQMPEGDLLSAAQDLRREAQTVLYVLVDDRLAGLVGMTDVAGAAVPETVQELRAEGVQVLMLTGDSRTTGSAVARDLGVDGVVAEVQPEDKTGIVQRLREEGRVVALVGVGGADGEALATADVGLITDPLAVPQVRSGVFLVENSLRAVVSAIRLGRRARSTVRGVSTFAAAFTVVGAAGAVLAAAVLPALVALPAFAALLPFLCTAVAGVAAARLRDSRL